MDKIRLKLCQSNEAVFVACFKEWSSIPKKDMTD